jgi:hypothetical protein
MAAEGAETVAYPPRPQRRSTRGALVIALLAVACQREQVRHFKVPKDVVAVPATADVSGMPEAPPQASDGEAGLRWTLPAGWKEAPGGGAMRYATLTAPVTGKLEVTVIRLPGPAGGELANVNRWRNQIGLPPIGEADLPAARKVVTTAAGPLGVYDFTSGDEKSRTIAGLASIQGETWFLKMTGETAAVAKARAAFLELLGSLRLEAR